MKVLVVENSLGFIQTFKNDLAGSGYIFDFTESRDVTTLHACSKYYDIFVVDLEYLQPNNFSILRTLRQLDNNIKL